VSVILYTSSLHTVGTKQNSRLKSCSVRAHRIYSPACRDPSDTRQTNTL